MNRIDFYYGGEPYSLGGRSIQSIQEEIAQAIATGLPYWLKVNSGEGRMEDAYLLIAPGIPMAMLNVNPNGGPFDVDDGTNEAYTRDVL